MDELDVLEWIEVEEVDLEGVAAAGSEGIRSRRPRSREIEAKWLVVVACREDLIGG